MPPWWYEPEIQEALWRLGPPRVLPSLPCDTCGALSPVGVVGHVAVHDCERDHWDVFAFPFAGGRA